MIRILFRHYLLMTKFIHVNMWYTASSRFIQHKKYEYKWLYKLY